MLPALDDDEARRELTGLLDGSIGAVLLAPLVVEATSADNEHSRGAA